MLNKTVKSKIKIEFTIGEEWLPVKGWENLYEVSSLGRVKSLPREKRLPIEGVYISDEKILRPIRYHSRLKKDRKDDNYYYQVALWRNGKNVMAPVHRLVAEAFIPNPQQKPWVNHINGNKGDNRVCNLEWVTASENAKHSVYVLGNKPLGAKRKKILCAETGIVFNGVREAASMIGVTASAISQAAHNYLGDKTSGGFHWKIIE